MWLLLLPPRLTCIPLTLKVGIPPPIITTNPSDGALSPLVIACALLVSQSGAPISMSIILNEERFMTRTDRTISSAWGGAPDWDSSKADNTIDITTPYTMTRDGVLKIYVSFDRRQGSFELFINEASVWRYSNWMEQDSFANTCLVRVSTGDVISGGAVTGSVSYIETTFYPLK